MKRYTDKPMEWQQADVGVAAKGIPAGGGHTWAVKWPKPFAATPVAWMMTTGYSWFIVQVSKVTATGCQVDLRNVASDPRPLVEVHMPVFAYGRVN